MKCIAAFQLLSLPRLVWDGMGSDGMVNQRAVY